MKTGNLIAYLYVCLTNFAGVPILFIEKSSNLRALVTCAMVASFLMHSIEYPLFNETASIRGLRATWRYWLAHKLDILFAWPLVAVYGMTYFQKAFAIWPACAAAILLCVISTEMPGAYKNPQLFALLHGTWHVVAFAIGLYLSKE